MKTRIRKLSLSAEIGMISDMCSFETVVKIVEMVASRMLWFIYDIKLQRKARDSLRWAISTLQANQQFAKQSVVYFFKIKQ